MVVNAGETIHQKMAHGMSEAGHQHVTIPIIDPFVPPTHACRRVYSFILAPGLYCYKYWSLLALGYENVGTSLGLYWLHVLALVRLDHYLRNLNSLMLDKSVYS